MKNSAGAVKGNRSRPGQKAIVGYAMKTDRILRKKDLQVWIIGPDGEGELFEELGYHQHLLKNKFVI